MPVLATGIHAFVAGCEGVDARDEREHNGECLGAAYPIRDSANS